MLRTMRQRSIGFMLIAMFSFALSDTFMKMALQSLPLPQALVIRGIPACLFILLIARVDGSFRYRLSSGDRRLLGLRSLMEVMATASFLTAMQHMPIGNLTAILQSVPLVATFAAALFLGETVGWRRALAVAVGFIGVLIVIRPGPSGFDLYALIGLVAVFFVVVRDLVTRRMSRDIPAPLVALGAAGMVCMLAAIWSAGIEWQPVTLQAATGIAVSAVFMTLAFISLVTALKAGNISATAPLRYAQLLWAILFGWLLFGDFPDMITLGGAALIVASGIFTLLREARLKG